MKVSFHERDRRLNTEVPSVDSKLDLRDAWCCLGLFARTLVWCISTLLRGIGVIYSQGGVDQNADNDIVKVHDLLKERPAVSVRVSEEKDPVEDWKRVIKKSKNQRNPKHVSKTNTQ